MIYKELSQPQAGDTVLVGMSGGVDSTLTTKFLLEKGCKVIGVTMSMWDGTVPPGVEIDKLPSSCFGPSEKTNIEECSNFCKEHNIEYHVVDVGFEYKKYVLEYFKDEYRKGRTPNPCINCNANVKFGAMLKAVEKLNIEFDYFCTGHYAKIVQAQDLFFEGNNPYLISTALDISKDQTYFLYRVPSEILKKVRFPLSDIKKQDVIRIAKESNLIAANREESQDFLGDEYFDWIFSDKPSVPGDIIDLDGKVLGRHRGIEHYTIGQRRGLGVASSCPMYVQYIDPKKNIVVLAPSEALNSFALIADNFCWPNNVEPSEKFDAYVKIRYASKPVLASIEKYVPNSDDLNQYNGQAWKISFYEAQRAIAPGQSAVLYLDNLMIGGGFIHHSL